ncbi:MaoC family dehydratase [Paracoccaceae bacterium]|nr:MaoC family dehydratase [Paracoccaceae bacterium]
MINENNNLGRFFEDYALGDLIAHATPRTLTEADASLYTAIYPTRFALQSSQEFAKNCGLKYRPLDDLIVFHTVFGKTVPDISINAVANLGYAEGKFSNTVFPGETLSVVSEIIGLKQNSNGKTGIVYVQTKGQNSSGKTILEYKRWVMVKKRIVGLEDTPTHLPDMKNSLDGSELNIPEQLDFSSYDTVAAGSKKSFIDYKVGELIDHIDGNTICEADHLFATRLWQNNSKVHFDVNARGDRKRLIYGGHIISLVRALSFNGLENAQMIIGINGGTHANPVFAEDTIYCWTEVLDKVDLNFRNIAALRLRSVGTKGKNPGMKIKDNEGRYLPNIVLDFDYWVLIPKEL